MTRRCRPVAAGTSPRPSRPASTWAKTALLWSCATTSATASEGAVLPFRQEIKKGALRAPFFCPRSEQVAKTVIQHRQHQGRPAQQLSTGEAAMRDAAEHIEALGLAGNRLSHQLAGQPGQRDAVSGETL